jgi:hypothetical protein
MLGHDRDDDGGVFRSLTFVERWLGKFEQRDKWIAGLTAAMMAAAQEA